MSLKKPRIHLTGLSNIDYKSKADIEKIFNDFKNFTIKPDKNNEPLDPTQVVIYKSPRPKRPNMYNVSLKEAIEQDGDSLLYADTCRMRKEMKLKRLEQNVNKNLGYINDLPKNFKKNETIDSHYFKAEQNKQSDETRLKNLRKNIQDKLFSHKNIQNIFVSWQKNYLKNDELTVFELHKKINELGIPLSYNEAFGLISMANKRNTNTLNLDEFKNLFFIDSEKIKGAKKISSIKIPENIDSKKIEDDNEIEENNKYKKFINNKIFENSHYNKLESMLNVKYSNFLNSMNELNDKENNKKGLCDFQTFKNVLDTLKIPEKYKNIYIAKSVFNEFQIENTDLMNYNNFINKCKNIKKPNDFFEFQNKYLNLLTKKLKDNEIQRNKCKDILLENDRKTKEYIKNLGQSKASKSMDKIFNNKYLTEGNEVNNYNKNFVNNKKLKNNITLDYSALNNKEYYTLNTEQNKINENNRYKIPSENIINDNNKESFSHYQPSLNFINLLFKDSKKYSDKLQEGIQEFNPNNVMNLKKNKRPDGTSINSRFFGRKDNYPPIFMSYDNTMPGYIEEKERFDRNRMYTIDRYNRDAIEKRNKKRNEINERWNNMIKFQQRVLDVKESLGQIKRTHNLYEYENRNVIRQQIDE